MNEIIGIILHFTSQITSGPGYILSKGKIMRNVRKCNSDEAYYVQCVFCNARNKLDVL